MEALWRVFLRGVVDDIVENYCILGGRVPDVQLREAFLGLALPSFPVG